MIVWVHIQILLLPKLVVCWRGGDEEKRSAPICSCSCKTLCALHNEVLHKFNIDFALLSFHNGKTVAFLANIFCSVCTKAQRRYSVAKVAIGARRSDLR